MHVALLGTGEMGSRMALSLLKAGHAVTVWNRTKDRTSTLVAQGASSADTPAGAVADADIAIAMVRDDDASRRVWLAPDDGALRTLPSQAIAVESSTLSLSFIRALAAAFAARGAAFLDAPVVGSRAQADSGQLIHLVGGEAEIFARAAPVLANIGAVAHHVGANGAGAALKLVVNALLGVQVAVLAELLGASESLGLDPARAVEILVQTPPCSPAAKMAALSILAKSFKPAFPIELLEKDLDYLAEAASALPVVAAARAVFARAQALGLGDENVTAVARLYA